jgi:hypothetical protein
MPKLARRGGTSLATLEVEIWEDLSSKPTHAKVHKILISTYGYPWWHELVIQATQKSTSRGPWSRPDWAQGKTLSQTANANWAAGVAQVVKPAEQAQGPEFKPQYRKKKVIKSILKGAR